ncbi:MAG: thiol-disulfide oxidoreductase DCC family protein [Planctomycetota bacterium]
MADDSRPILLFDGVCNLCDAAVQFVIDRDRKERFRFAALQSDAARAALRDAGAPHDLPDSMIVIDGDGIRTRSDAALAVARRLGFPWSLLVVLWIVPRFIRDPMYAWIARNRYRWFGRQTACRVPMPELRERFLDADEPVRAVAPEEPTLRQASSEARGLGLATLPHRLVLVYPVVFMLPFPLTLLSLLDVIPGVGGSFIATARNWLIGLHGEATQPAIAWLGRVLTGETPSFEFTGSGDGVASYLGVLLDLIIACVVAVGWWAWRRGRPVSRRTADACRVLVRYFLISVMLSYGLSKVFPLQFAAMGPDRILQPYGDSSPMGLLWTFMGASTGYQMFGGWAEVLGAVLLVFRRTSLLGALAVAAVMTNVFAMNVFFDVPVKLYSFHYLVFALLIALPDVPRLAGFFVANVPVAARDLRPFWHGSRSCAVACGLLKVALVGGMLWSNTESRLDRMRSSGPWAEKSDLHGIYRVESFELSSGGSAEPGAGWLRVGLNPPWSATVQFADGLARRMRMRLDEEASTLALYDRSLLEPEDEPMTLERLDDGRVRLTGVFEGEPVVITMRPDGRESLFASRGFNWINEYPFNR